MTCLWKETGEGLTLLRGGWAACGAVVLEQSLVVDPDCQRAGPASKCNAMSRATRLIDSRNSTPGVSLREFKGKVIHFQHELIAGHGCARVHAAIPRNAGGRTVGKLWSSGAGCWLTCRV